MLLGRGPISLSVSLVDIPSANHGKHYGASNGSPDQRPAGWLQLSVLAQHSHDHCALVIDATTMQEVSESASRLALAGGDQSQESSSSMCFDYWMPRLALC